MAKAFDIKLTRKGKDFYHGVMPKIPEAIKRGINAASHQVGEKLLKTVRDGIERQQKTGKIYKRKGRKAKRASAPGQYAGIVSGGYLKSWDFDVRGASQLIFGTKRPTIPEELPTSLEEGTSKIKPRPGLQLAVNARQKDTIVIYRRTGAQFQTRLGKS